MEENAKTWNYIGLSSWALLLFFVFHVDACVATSDAPETV